MSIQVRDLLPKVMVHRPDLDNERGMWALRESALRVAKETLLATNETATYVEPNSRIFTPVVSGEQIIRFTDLKTANPDGVAEFVGDYNALTETPELPIPRATTIGTDTFTQSLTALPTRTNRFAYGMYAMHPNGYMYVTNGYSLNAVAGEMLKFKDGVWSACANPPVARSKYVTVLTSGSGAYSNNEMVVLDDGRVVDFGNGWISYNGSYNGNDRSMSIYDPTLDEWTLFTDCFPYIVAIACQYFYYGGTKIGVYSGGATTTGSAAGQASVGVYGNIVVYDVDSRIVVKTIPVPFTEMSDNRSHVTHVMLDADNVVFVNMVNNANYEVYKFTISTETFVKIAGPIACGQSIGNYQIPTISNSRYLIVSSQYSSTSTAYATIIDLTTGLQIGSTISIATSSSSIPGAGCSIGIDNTGDRFAAVTTHGYYSYIIPTSGSQTASTLIAGVTSSAGGATLARYNGAPMIVGNIATSPYRNVFGFDPLLRSNLGDSYLVATPGNGLSAGDILTSDGTNWNVTTTTGYQNTYQTNIPSNNMAVNGKVSDGVTSWAQDNGSIYWYGDTSSGFFAKTRYSYVPTDRDFDEIGLPTEAEDAVVEGALELIYMMPGAGRDPNQATYYRRTYKTAVSQLRAVQMFGYGGSPTFNAPFFAGRPTYGTGW